MLLSLTKGATTWMLRPPVNATAVGQTGPREPAVGAWLLCLHCSGRSRARMRVKDDRPDRSAGVIPFVAERSSAGERVGASWVS